MTTTSAPPRPPNLGDLEQLLLLALLRLGEDAHGVSIRTELLETADRALSPGAIYTAMNRLQARGLVESSLGRPAEERGGKRRRLYQITPSGRSAIRAAYSRLRAMANGVEADLEPA